MARYAKVDRRIWNDARFGALSERGKLVFLFLLTHPNGTMLGAMRATEAGLAAELKMPVEVFRQAFGEGLTKGIVKHDFEASCLWLPNFLKYNKPESPNVVRAWPDVFDLIPECELKSQLFEQLKVFVQGLSEGFREAFAEAFPKDYVQPVTVTETGVGAEVPAVSIERKSSSKKSSALRSTDRNAGPPIGSLPCLQDKNWPFTQQDVDEWTRTYTAADVMHELRSMRQWLLANHKKTYGGMRKFVVNWLSKAHDRKAGYSTAAPKPVEAESLSQRMKREKEEWRRERQQREESSAEFDDRSAAG